MIRKFWLLFLLLFIFCSFSFQKQDTVCFRGFVVDENGLPLENAKVSIWVFSEYQYVTDKKGQFISQPIPFRLSYTMTAGKEGYFSRSLYERFDPVEYIGDTIYPFIKLRSRKSAVTNTSEISEKDLGMSLREAVKKFNLDTAEWSLITEPPGISRGIRTELADSTYLFLQIDRTVNNHYFKPIMREKIIGIGLAYPNCTQKLFGNGFVFGIYSPYCQK